jgi:hypothetical protein
MPKTFTELVPYLALVISILAFVYRRGTSDQTVTSGISIIRRDIDEIRSNSIIRINTRMDALQLGVADNVSKKEFKEALEEIRYRQEDVRCEVQKLSVSVGILRVVMGDGKCDKNT